MTAPSPTFSNSVSLTGAAVGQTIDGGAFANGYRMPDLSVDGINVNTPAGINWAISQGSAVLAKGPDGALHWYRLGGSYAQPIFHFIAP